MYRHFLRPRVRRSDCSGIGDGGSVDVRTLREVRRRRRELGTTIGEAAMLTDDTSDTVAVGEINPANY